MTVRHFDLPIDAETFLAARGDILKTLFPDAPAIEGAEPFMTALQSSVSPMASPLAQRERYLN